MASQNLLVLLVLCVMAAAASAGNVHNMGWTFGSNMGSINVNAGDTVEFSYEAGVHDVNQVSQNAYYACDASTPKATYSSGDDYVAFPSQGAYYFICSKSGHCNAGMKLVVYVQ